MKNIYYQIYASLYNNYFGKCNSLFVLWNLELVYHRTYVGFLYFWVLSVCIIIHLYATFIPYCVSVYCLLYRVLLFTDIYMCLLISLSITKCNISANYLYNAR